jgi:hypothetical protein
VRGKNRVIKELTHGFEVPRQEIADALGFLRNQLHRKNGSLPGLPPVSSERGPTASLTIGGRGPLGSGSSNAHPQKADRPSVLFVLADPLQANEARPGEYGVMCALGPGSCLELVLVQW